MRNKWVNMYRAYRRVASTEQMLRNSTLSALSHRKGKSFHLFLIHKTCTFIKHLNMAGSELEVMISLNSSSNPETKRSLPCFNNEDQRSHLTFLRSHSMYAAEQGFQPKSPDGKILFFSLNNMAQSKRRCPTLLGQVVTTLDLELTTSFPHQSLPSPSYLRG